MHRDWGKKTARPGERWKAIHEATRSGFVDGIRCGFVDRSYVIHRNTRNEAQARPDRFRDLLFTIHDLRFIDHAEHCAY